MLGITWWSPACGRYLVEDGRASSWLACLLVPHHVFEQLLPTNGHTWSLKETDYSVSCNVANSGRCVTIEAADATEPGHMHTHA